MYNLKRKISSMNSQQRIPPRASVLKLYTTRLQEYFTQRYMSHSIPFNDLLRARREFNIVQSIRQKLIKYQLILRPTDKSGIPYIGRTIDYQRKTMEYRTKTSAYKELSSSPYNDIIFKVARKLYDLASMGKIKQFQKQIMMPIRSETELAYMYCLPKLHKVIIIFFFFLLNF